LWIDFGSVVEQVFDHIATARCCCECKGRHSMNVVLLEKGTVPKQLFYNFDMTRPRRHH
jgi:hypothetical protein